MQTLTKEYGNGEYFVPLQGRDDWFWEEKIMKSVFRGRVSGLALALCAVSMPAAVYAQGSPADEDVDSAVKDKEIVVTGTLIRGIAPVGTNVVSVSADDVKVTGATTTAQLLQTIPQLGSFNTLYFPPASGNTTTVNRPNLRNLPGFTTAGGSTTLVLMDGHRLVGAGIVSTTPDPDIIPPGAIERVEIIPDGGSAVYGSDAVAGVINFITRRKFDGFQADGHYGFADKYHQWDVSATAGKDWGAGGIYVSYNYAEHTNLLGRDRDYVRQYPFAGGVSNGFINTACPLGNVLVGTTLYGLPYTTATAATVAGKPNQ
jgi:iron complex outermembrane receptor protein